MKRDCIGGDPEEIHFLQPNQICDRAISIGSVKINPSLLSNDERMDDLLIKTNNV